MSKIDELLAQLCPNGVEFKTLGELGTFLGGLSGKSKEDFKDGNAKFITYMNVFSNISLNLDVTDTVRISEGEKQNTIQYGDVLFTGSSETPNECGMSSVLTVKTAEMLYLNSFCFIYRFSDPELFLPSFSKYLFRSDYLRKQIIKTASGVTRFNVSKAKMAKVKIPVPPLEVQAEIVKILDEYSTSVTALQQELEKELIARKKQYEYYRDLLLDFGVHGGGTSECEWRTVSGLGSWTGGCTPSMNNSKYWDNGTIPWISSKDMKFATLSDTEDHITDLAIKETSIKLLPKNITAIVARSGILKHTLPVVYIPFETTVNQDIKALIPSEDVLPRYAYFVLAGFSKRILKSTKKQGGTVDSLDMNAFMRYPVPVPTIEKQERIISILERFDKLCNDISEGLPAEIEARRKQYEYYRDKLLSFKEQ